MDLLLSRRRVLGLAALPLLALPGCGTVGDALGPGLEDAIRRIEQEKASRARGSEAVSKSKSFSRLFGQSRHPILYEMFLKRLY